MTKINLIITVLIIFIFSCIASFVGSLQLGPVNLFVLNCALYEGKRTAFLVALGGCLPEFIYCTLAVVASNFIAEYEWLIAAIKIIFSLTLITLGFLFYFKKQTAPIPKNQAYKKSKPRKYILKGFLLAIFNPQLLPFWIFVQVYFNSIDFLKIQSIPQKVSYILGAGVGAFVLLAAFILCVQKYYETFLKFIVNKYYFKALSFLFFALASYQIWQIINS